jgi:hypothetical protein
LLHSFSTSFWSFGTAIFFILPTVSNGRSFFRFVEQTWFHVHLTGIVKIVNGFNNDFKVTQKHDKANDKEFIVYSKAKFAQHVKLNPKIEVGANDGTLKHPFNKIKIRRIVIHYILHLKYAI